MPTRHRASDPLQQVLGWKRDPLRDACGQGYEERGSARAAGRPLSRVSLDVISKVLPRISLTSVCVAKLARPYKWHGSKLAVVSS